MNSFENSQTALDAQKPSLSFVDNANFDAVAGLKQLLQINKEAAPAGPGDNNQGFLTWNTDSLYKTSFTKPAETSEKVEPAEKNSKEAVAGKHAELSAWSKDHLYIDDQKRFDDNMDKFEKDARARGVSDDEILRTYDQVERLTTAQGDKPLSADERNIIAASIVENAANPTKISQGQYNTCNVTTVETRSFTRTPAEAARVISDVALTGQYTAKDGTTVHVDPTETNAGRNWPTPDGARSHADQIFQVAAVNLHYASIKSGPESQWEYQQRPADEYGNGERILDHKTNAVAQRVNPDTNEKYEVRDPGLSTKEIAEISNKITGEDEKDILLQSYRAENTSVTNIQDNGQLDDKLAQLKKDGGFPVIVNVSTNAEPFYYESNKDTVGGAGGSHVVTITDYDPINKTVCVDNQWLAVDDHGKANPITTHDLYIAMQSKEDQALMLKNEANADRQDGVYNPSEEAGALRNQIITGQVNEVQAKREITRIQDELKNHHGESVADGKQREVACHELEMATNQLSLDSQVELNQQAMQKGLMTREEMEARNQFAKANTFVIGGAQDNAAQLVESDDDNQLVVASIWDQFEKQTQIQPVKGK